MTFQIIPTLVLRGISSSRDVIYPSQYYTQSGEIIFKVFFNHNYFFGFAFYHFDYSEKLIAYNFFGEDVLNIKNRFIFSKNEFEKFKNESVKFETLFNEMHVLSKSMPRSSIQNQDIIKLKDFFNKPPIIIGGCGRSGTTLLASIFASHPKVHVISQETYSLCTFPFRLQWMFDDIDNGIKKGSVFLCEKTPKNIRYFQDIYNFFGGSVKLIHIVRNFKDVVKSIHPTNPKKPWVPLERWVADVSIGLKSKNISYIIKYEDLLTNLNHELENLFKFCGIPFHKNTINHSEFTTLKNHYAWGKDPASPINKNKMISYSFEYNKAYNKETYLRASKIAKKLGYNEN